MSLNYATSVKFFLISKPGVLGIGNGMLQDILFRAKIHPRRKALETSLDESTGLYTAIRQTLQQAIDGGGRDTDRDLYDHPGKYVKILDSRTVGMPCPECGTETKKESFLGGAIYFCSKCQT